MPVTQKQIAEMAGVSINTVSVVLRNSPDALISEATRQTVVRIAEELGYRPNPYARALVGAKAPLIKIAHRPWDDYISNAKGVRLLTALKGLGRDVIVTSHSEDDVQATVDALLWGAPEAVVLQYPRDNVSTLSSVCCALHERGVHVVVADYPGELPPDVPCDAIFLDRVAGSRRAMEHLLELGHSQIGLLVAEGHEGRESSYHAILAGQGVEQRHVERLGSFDSTDSTFTERKLAAAAMHATARLLERSPEITALLCSSDTMALGAMGAVSSAGRSVPEDVSVMGFHGEPWTEYLPVPLSTMEEPVEQMASFVGETLAGRLDGDRSAWKRSTVQYLLACRASTGVANVRTEDCPTRVQRR